MPALSSGVRRTLLTPMLFGLSLLLAWEAFRGATNLSRFVAPRPSEPRYCKLKDWMPRGELAAA